MLTRLVPCTLIPALLVGCSGRPPGAAMAAGLPPRPAKKPVRLLAVGDLMLGTSVKKQIREKGPAYPFRKYRDLLTEADLTFGNLETPLSDRGTPTAGKSQESLDDKTNFIFRAPPSSAEGLAEAGFDVVSLANNHMMDYGSTALQDTLESLQEAKVAGVGAGEDWDSAMQPVFLERNGQRFSFFAISDILPLYSAATKTSPGVAPARGRAFTKGMPKLIAAAHKKADWVVVSVHWGVEKFTGATERQKNLGHQLIDWGADAVIGSHTHVLGPTERYHGGVIHYSLGNFIGNPGSRKDVGLWEIRFDPGERPTELSLLYNWKAEPVSENAKARQKVALRSR
jgi:poly-gamma-glutamate synthesis protein (capsule biosynthesis protein)